MARRVQLMVRLGREVPELPPGLLFSDTEPRLPAAIARPGRLPPYPGARGHPAGLHPTVRRGLARRTNGRVRRAPVRGRGPHSQRQATTRTSRVRRLSPFTHPLSPPPDPARAMQATARSRGRTGRRSPPKTCISSGGRPCTAGHPEPGSKPLAECGPRPMHGRGTRLRGGGRLGGQGLRPPLPPECRFPTWQRLRVLSRSRTASETPGWP